MHKQMSIRGIYKEYATRVFLKFCCLFFNCLRIYSTYPGRGIFIMLWAHSLQSTP